MPETDHRVFINIVLFHSLKLTHRARWNLPRGAWLFEKFSVIFYY